MLLCWFLFCFLIFKIWCSLIMHQIGPMKTTSRNGLSCDLDGLPESIWPAWEIIREQKWCKLLAKFGRQMPKVRVLTTQIHPSESSWRSLFSSFFTNFRPFLSCFLSRISFLHDINIGVKVLWNRTLSSKKGLWESFIWKISGRISEFFKYAKFSNFGASEI